TASRWNRLLNPHSPRSRSHFIGTASIELPTSRYPARRGRLATSPKKESLMTKRTLPLLIGLSVCTAAMAQQTPAPAQSGTTTQIVTTTTHWGTQPPEGALTEDAIKTAIANAGYREVKGLKVKDGVWRSRARGGNDQWVKITVGPLSGKVYVTDAPSPLNKDEIKA